MKIAAVLLAACCCATLLGGEPGVDAFPTGAPQSACRSMNPSHRSQPSTEPSPFIITFSAPGYRSYDQITVNISSTNPDVTFKGFMLAAKGVSGMYANEFVGSFITPDRRSLTTRACNGKMVTQSINRPVTSITAKWRAPYRPVGPVVFQATVVEKFLRYWVDIRSEQLNVLP